MRELMNNLKRDPTFTLMRNLMNEMWQDLSGDLKRVRTSFRPSLLTLLVAASSLSLAAKAAEISQSLKPSVGATETKLGVAIKDDLNERDKAAAERARALDLRERIVNAAQARLKTRMTTANGARPDTAESVAAGGSRQSEAANEQYITLARIYQAMKPADAARVLEQLDLKVQSGVARQMRERSTAAIMGKMTPEAAGKLSMALANGT